MNFILNQTLNEFNKLGIATSKVEYYGTNYISIYVEKYKNIKATQKLCRKHSNRIIKLVQQEIDSRNLSVFSTENKDKYKWDLHCINNIYSLEDDRMAELVRDKKEEIITAIKTEIAPAFQPEYVFSHSSNQEYPAGYYILYENKKQFKLINNAHKEKIRGICTNVLSQSNAFSKDRFDLTFSHTEDPNMFGAYRED